MAAFRDACASAEGRFEWIFVGDSADERALEKPTLTYEHNWILMPLGFQRFLRLWAEFPNLLFLIALVDGSRALCALDEHGLAEGWWGRVCLTLQPAQWKGRRVFVREVPSCVVLHCAARVTPAQSIEAVFSTLAGPVVAEVARLLPQKLYMRDLVDQARQAAMTAKLLQSPNQQVHVVLNNFAAQPTGDVLLWNGAALDGWLHRC